MPFVSLLIAGTCILTPKRLWRKAVVILIIIAIFTGVSSVAYDASATLAGSQYAIPTDFFSPAELDANGFLIQHGHGPVVTDFIYTALLFFQRPNYSGGPISYTYASLQNPKGYLLVRTGELAQRGLRFSTLTYGYETQINVNPNVVLAQLESMSVVYDNGNVAIAVSG